MVPATHVWLSATTSRKAWVLAASAGTTAAKAFGQIGKL
jgi:hypothetical protein